MKWLGQYIQSFTARFRDDVYLESISTGTIASGAHLGLDSNNKIVKAADGGGDLTAIVAGTGLSGSSLSGPIPTLNVDATQTGITRLGTLGSLTVTSASDLGSAAITLTNQDADQIALDINAENTTANIIDIASETLSTGNAIGIATAGLTTGSGLYLNIDDTLTATAAKKLINIDYDKAGVTATSATSTTTGLAIDMADAAINHSLGAVTMVGAQIGIDSTSTHGTITQKGLVLSIAADGVGDAATTSGIEMEVMDGGTDIKMMSHADTADYCAIATTTNGATTITTVDGGAQAAHFEIAADGDITLDANGDIKLEPKSGGSILLDGTIDVDAGVVTGATSITSTAFVGDLTGEADTAVLAADATTLATTRAINGVNFDGSAAITIPTNRVWGAYIKLLPIDFMPNDDGGTSKGVTLNDSGTTGLKPGIAAMELVAIADIPEGFTATHVDVYDNSHDLAINVFEMNIGASGMTARGSGNANTTLDITDVESTVTNFLAIRVETTATSERVFGGRITIAPN